jgi:uncharacterized protein (TIGR03790 family)
MKKIARFLLLLVAIAPAAGAAISPESVAVLYNSALPESRQLAEQYRDARGIPAENLIALEMPATADISREDYERTILKPLRREFEHRVWWQRRTDSAGTTIPVINRIRVLVTMRGVPLRIQSVKPPAPIDPQNPIAGRDEASVDSELAMFGVEGLPADGILQNKYYRSEKSISDAEMPFLVLVARIDAPRFTTCQRMIRDTFEAEKTGLWGRAYVDIANKFPQGDQWLEDVVKANGPAGIPTVVDRFDDTLPKNYPMTDASLYYGWYDWHVSGPFLNHRFQFRRGAVAMHLHSFSAEQLSDPAKNWSGPLLERGAAVTVGNVYEPYLHLTHDYGMLHQRLLAGFTWVEACWMAMPVTSWQAVVLGDPLYRPFRHLDGGGTRQDEDIEFRALRAAAIEWKSDPRERQKQLEKAAERMKSGILAEAVGLDLLQRRDMAGATRWFDIAKRDFPKTEDKLRQDLHKIGIDRSVDRKDSAIAALREARDLYGPIAEAEALQAWLDILDPPPPPPVPVPAPPNP